MPNRRIAVPRLLGRRMRPAYTNFYRQKDDIVRRYSVQGKRASKNEFNVAVALDTLGFDYEFQVGLAGGRSVASGFVLDFLVDTKPLPTPLWVNGEWWHTGERRNDDLRQQAVLETFTQGAVAPAQELWGSQTDTVELALMNCRRIFMGAL